MEAIKTVSEQTVTYPSVTVGVPFYAGVDVVHLQEAIDSVLSQTLKPDKVILIQDGSVTPAHENLIQKYVNDYNYIQHIVIPINTGLPYALNLSILACDTKYYARMDADDISHPERLRKQIDFLEENTDIDIVGTWAYEFDREVQDDEDCLMKVPTIPKEIVDWSHYRNPLIHPSVVFRRSVFAKIGLYDTRLSTGARDLVLWIRALKIGVGITNLPEPLLYYRCGDSVIKRRARLDRVIRQAVVRFSHWTFSPRLNSLKFMAILFRLMPLSIQRYGYSLRNR